ncbi:hypothetical protein [Halohasta salina]|uniref:hypothetical protein n=1 Tax=Halohasta salina TaxID=2961621 RepID=UPI0020A603FE|nr:hypothetical protein [Halohasta salina]
MTVDSALDDRLAALPADTLGEGVDSTLTGTDAGYRVVIADRTLDLERRAGPDGSTHWITTLRVDGETVGKFGPDASTDALLDRCRRVLSSDATYTVCCDGRPESLR